MASNPQEKLTNWLWRFAGIFFFLYASTLTFEYYLIEWWFEIIGVPFRWLAEQTGMLFFGVNLLGAEEFYSDSLLVFVHVFDLMLIAFVGATIWTILSKASTPRPNGLAGRALSLTKFTDTKFHPFLLTLLRYFVALNLLVYGFSKLYKWQFMLPEPNILYTRVGEMHRDILYWTSMGSSRSYTMFMGVIEIVPAILLLFRRTTLIGALVSVLVMMNIVAVNFGFDITVKLHSMILLSMSLVILIPGRRRIIALFNGKAVEDWRYPAFVISENRKWTTTAVKVVAVVFLIAESHYPYTTTGIYNDDVSERPPMHGAYEVILTLNSKIDSSENKELIRVEDSLSRIFIHRRGYIIFQNKNDAFTDFPVSIDTTQRKFNFNGNHAIEYESTSDSTWYFTDVLARRIYMVKKLDWEKLPLLEEEFTVIDED